MEKITLLFKNRRMGDFVCNFTAVVLGIILTFMGSDWIEKRNTQRDVKSALLLVKLHTKSPILRFLKRRVIFSTVLFSFYHSLISLNNFSGIMYYENHYSAKIIQESNINKTIPIPIIHPMMNPFQKNSPLLFGIENKSFYHFHFFI